MKWHPYYNSALQFLLLAPASVVPLLSGVFGESSTRTFRLQRWHCKCTSTHTCGGGGGGISNAWWGRKGVTWCVVARWWRHPWSSARCQHLQEVTLSILRFYFSLIDYVPKPKTISMSAPGAAECIFGQSPMLQTQLFHPEFLSIVNIRFIFAYTICFQNNFSRKFFRVR